MARPLAILAFGLGIFATLRSRRRSSRTTGQRCSFSFPRSDPVPAPCWGRSECKVETDGRNATNQRRASERNSAPERWLHRYRILSSPDPQASGCAGQEHPHDDLAGAGEIGRKIVRAAAAAWP
jgi:hypothetical protein